MNKQDSLIRIAREASKKARCHISGYHVGAAIFTDLGIFRGCNIEFDNFSNTLHAEEVAIGCAIANGATKFLAIAVWSQDCAYPCGMCRQSLFEIGGAEMGVFAASPSYTNETIMGRLLPYGFKFIDCGMTQLGSR